MKIKSRIKSVAAELLQAQCEIGVFNATVSDIKDIANDLGKNAEMMLSEIDNTWILE